MAPMAAGQWLLRTKPARLADGVQPMLQPLAVLGRRPLSFYMLHQPILIGLILLARNIRALD